MDRPKRRKEDAVEIGVIENGKVKRFCLLESEVEDFMKYLREK